MDMKMLEKYANLVVRAGVNLQDKQQLVINSPIECASFARMIAKKAYEAGAINMTKEQLVESGINDSLIHVDFMIGSSELEIVGETANGERIHVFRNGEWIL